MELSLEWVLGILVTFIAGGYMFTWKATRSLWRAIANLYNNHLKSLDKRISKLEK